MITPCMSCGQNRNKAAPERCLDKRLHFCRRCDGYGVIADQMVSKAIACPQCKGA